MAQRTRSGYFACHTPCIWAFGLTFLTACSGGSTFGDSSVDGGKADTVDLVVDSTSGDSSTDTEECTGYLDVPGGGLFPGFADLQTTALWLFDDPVYPHTTLTDASWGEHDLRLMAGGRLETGKYGRGLRVAPGPEYEVSYAGFRGSISNEYMREEDGEPSGLWSPTAEPRRLLRSLICGTWTVEWWLNLATMPSSRTTVLDMGDASLPGLSIHLEASASALAIENHYAGESYVIAASSPIAVVGKWVHIAAVIEAGSARLYVDGVDVGAGPAAAIPVQPLPPDSWPTDFQHEHRGFTAETTDEWRRARRFNLSLGEDRKKQAELDATLDELRFSAVARYVEDGTAPTSFSRAHGSSPPPPAKPSGPALLFPPGGPSFPILLGGRKHLFVDLALIDTHDNVKIKVNRLDKPEPLKLLTPSGPTDFIPEMGRWRETVYDHDGKVWLYIGEGYSTPQGRNWIYHSQDGLSFTAPSLGMYKDEQYDNIILDDYPNGAIVFKDGNPDATVEERFKMSAWCSNRGIYIFLSPDGLHWRRNEVAMLPLAVGGDAEVFWDDQRGLYFNMMKRGGGTPTSQTPSKGRAGVLFKTDRVLEPWPFTHLAQPYFESWPFPLMSDEGVTALAPREIIGIGGYAISEEVYRPRPMKYEWAPDTYVAFPHRSYINLASLNQNRSTELAVSRDGESWTDYPYDDHEWLMPPVGTLGGVQVTEGLSFYGMIRRGDEVWLYVEYNTDGAPNGQDGFKQYFRLRMKLDRFAALNAGNNRGHATTHPFQFSGSRLELNLKTTTGWVKVEILDETGSPVPGYSIADADAMGGVDSLRQTVTWNGDGDLSSLAGKTIRLHFEIENSKIYAMQFLP